MEKVDLSANDIGKKVQFHILVNSVQQLNNLCSILFIQGIQNLTNLLSRKSFIGTMNLEDNALGDHAISILCHALICETAPCVKDLNLSRNNIGQGGARFLSELLLRNKSITSLKLAWNSIRGLGAQQIAKALGGKSTLKTLDISWNGFGGKAVW